jgi:HSP20 family molecular chaperone IbpA
MTDLDDIFNEMDVFYKKLMKRLFKEIDELEKTINGQDMENGWKTRPIKTAHTKNYLGEGKTGLTEIPELPQVPKYATEEPLEPLTDIIEEKGQVRIYTKLPAVDKKDIKLNVCNGYAEIKTNSFHKSIKLPTKRLAMEKASATYKNGVLQVTIPKAKLFFDRSGKNHAIELT